MGRLARRSYGQDHCPIAGFLDLLGERWTLLVVRELLLAHPEPVRFGELLDQLPGLSRNLLSTRLGELEGGGIVRRAPGGPSSGWLLTRDGVDIAPVLRSMGEWTLDRSGRTAPAKRSRLSSLG